MDCPVDGTVLQMTERQGIEIDYCPQCRGVWLDRGELDKMIERSATYDQRRPQPRTQARPQPMPYQAYGKKRKNFLSEVFDFD